MVYKSYLGLCFPLEIYITCVLLLIFTLQLFISLGRKNDEVGAFRRRFYL